MKKQYNNHEYRRDKRIVAFVRPEIKKSIEDMAANRGRSVSAVIGDILEKHFEV